MGVLSLNPPGFMLSSIILRSRMAIGSSASALNNKGAFQARSSESGIPISRSARFMGSSLAYCPASCAVF